MNELFGYSRKELLEKKAMITAEEINQQPDIWLETIKIIKNKKDKINEFVSSFFSGKEEKRIILTGAGSSAFVGEIAQAYISTFVDVNVSVEAIATTDIVSYPNKYLKKDVKTVLVSCARSGNSPESLAAVKLSEQIVEGLYKINLTCNPEGELAKNANNSKTLTLMMPEKSNDKGFAMTGSFSSMLLSMITVFQLENIDKVENIVNTISNSSMNIVNEKYNIIKEIAKEDFSRIVYLGSANFEGLARESSLKILELTAGKVTTLYDTPLGFRHGPKSYVNEDTVIVLFLSNNEYTRQYDFDLLKEVKTNNIAKKIVAISSYKDEAVEEYADIVLFNHDSNIDYLDDTFLSFEYLLYAQLISLFKSLQLGITPDNPSPTGVVNRVVKGVNIYPLNK
jgi:tagatose-6-phosphate ketose/aldose isomerase